ncbi:MAG: BMP family ABC transporter substrate-binding protein [Candidatus Bipolaricaulota bacterium]|nr:BMP family ABC transporter substrate-binding protein [Candidatus Bipolaricaulota bacterium]MDW8152444.1 BMP family ABC transporter substrate-binding protein [Candidatus Bipolaricaulota bacterium]
MRLWRAALVALGVVALATPGFAAKKICLYFDQTGPGDLSFNDMAILGAQRAAQEFGLILEMTTAASPLEFLSDLASLAETGEYVLIVGVGFLLFDALPEAARLYPQQKFAFVDGPNFGLPNVIGLLFKEQEGGALAGVVAALVALAHGDPAVGAVAGMEIPPVWRYEAGYRFGAYWAVDWYRKNVGPAPDLRVLVTYVGRFDDPAGGKVATEALLRAGARNILGIAGATHLGTFDAVEEAGRAAGRTYGPPFAYGADAAQEYIKPGFILGSARKRVDTAVYEAVRWALGKEPGFNLVLGIAQEGTGFSTEEDIRTFVELAVKAGYPLAGTPQQVLDAILGARKAMPEYVWRALAEFEALLRAGAIKLPDADTAEQIAEVRARYP